MRIAIVGGTGNVGRPLALGLLAAGHDVTVLTRGGAGADALRAAGATTVVGSFDSDSAEPDDFFVGADAAFTMVRSDWGDVDHYPVVAHRLARALSVSPPSRIVSLSSIGADLEHAGHSSDFGTVERILDEVQGAGITHLRAGWFMENFLASVDEVGRSGTFTTAVRPDLPLPLVATRDVARAALAELVGPRRAVDGVLEVQGPEDVTTASAVTTISDAVGTDLRVVFRDRRADDPAEATGRTPEDERRLQYALESNAAFNDGRARFHTARDAFDLASTPFATFVDDVWLPAYRSR